MRYITILIFVLTAGLTFGQSNDPEYWRDLGYQSKIKGDLRTSITQYSRILSFSKDDYDARLALARLYFQVEAFDTAIIYYNDIFMNDSTDVEALNGLGECYLLKQNFDKSISCFQKSISVMPEDVKTYFTLAKVYTIAGRFDDAIEVYKQINEIDPTYSESWAGMGKLYYWKGMPLTASLFYKKALKLDPGNEEIKNEYNDVLGELKFGLTIKASLVQEEEESYNINALVNSIKLEKRVTDYFQVEANFLLDYSKRDFINNIGDTTRWYNNSWIKGHYYFKASKFSLFGGYSTTDKKVTSYGFNWLYSTNFGKISIKNNITTAYDYYYYWNQVGSKSLVDNLQLGFKLLKVNARYAIGVVDPLVIKDILNDTAFIHTNDFNSWGLSIHLKIFSKPDINIGLNHSYLNYNYKSAYYYAPFGRNLTGASISVYYGIKKFYLYSNFNYNLGTEFNYEQYEGPYEKVNVNVDNWSGELELGYDYYPLSISTGISRFNNPYYKSLAAFILIKVIF